MFILVWIFLLASSTDADHPELGQYSCYNGFCVRLNKDVITAEAGLCAVIHCSFNTPWNFYPSSLIWFKCEPGQSCTESDIIFHSKNQNKIQPSFSGRVSLLESNLWSRNCSIIINDLQLSDSGKYYLRLNSDNDRASFSFHRATISIKALQQKPTVLSPALTEGQHASLTCTAPGLCSGPEPTFTWTWRGAEAPPNITTATTDRLTPVNHRHSSTVELRASAELHGAELSCTVSYNHGTSSTQDSVRINVTYVKEIEVSGDTVVKEGDSLNVTCSVDSFPPSRIMWFGPNKTSLNVSETTERSNQTDLGSASLLIPNVTAAQSGQYMCEGLHLDSSQTRDVNISVIYLREPVLTGDTSVVEGGALSLTCTVDSFPPSNITLRGAGSDMNSSQTDPGSVSLLISNVTLEDAGRYECTVEHELRTLSTSVDVKVLWKPHILNSSGCVYDQNVLSCSCVSRGSPVPAVTWPLLRHHAEYTLVTTVTGDTVNSSLVLRASEHNRTGVQCVSSNRAGQVQESFTPSISTGTAEPSVTPEKIMRVVSRLEVIIAFLAGFILAAVLCFVVIKCHRRRQKNVAKEQSMTEPLEMVHSEEEPELNGHTVEVNANTEPGEVHYASINFSAITRNGQRDRANREETKTEYAEIKREVIEQRQKNRELQEETPEDKEEAAMMEDTKQSVPAEEEEEEEEAALYSNVREILTNE